MKQITFKRYCKKCRSYEEHTLFLVSDKKGYFYQCLKCLEHPDKAKGIDFLIFIDGEKE